jgi:cobalamin biosynthesis protein CobD/CbiB
VPIAALAGALGVTLGGPRRHENGHTIGHGWIGPAGTSARLGTAEVRRGALLLMVVFMIAIALVAGITSLLARIF